MRAVRHPLSPVPAALVAVAASLLLASCVTTRPQQFRTFLIPPSHLPPPPQDPPANPPRLESQLYANEAPVFADKLPLVKRPSDADFLIKKAEDRFAAGKRALAEHRWDDAREEFNKTIEILLGAPENLPERPRVERRLEELAEGIYRYDLDRLSAADSSDKVAFDKSPRDTIPELTFPVDPSLRNKVKEQIAATASQLPLEESDAVVSYVNFFSSERGKRILAGGIRRSGRYKAIIERALREEGLPPELIFLAQAESGFLPRAVSNKLCVGLWQFAKFRGAEYGLTQTSATDDRMDPEKATRAAARHLHDLYTHFGDWYLAMAAYDCGPGCVDHAVMRTGYADFWALRRMNVLPKETANYVPVILAMIIVAKNAKDYGLELGAYDPPMEFETIELQTPTHLALIAEAVDRPISELKDLNPALLRAVAPAGYAVHVPVGTVEAVERAFAIVPAGRRDAWRLHRMEAGDTFAALAKRYKSDTLMIASANHQALPEAGSWAAIPVSYPGDRTPARVSSKTGASKPKTAASKTPLTRKKPAATQHRVTASNKSAASNKSSAKPVLAKTSGTAL